MTGNTTDNPKQKLLPEEVRAQLRESVFALSDVDPKLREHATSFVLQLVKTENSEALNYLIGRLHDSQRRDSVKKLIIQACSEGPEDSSLVRRCSAVLHDPNVKTRDAATEIMISLATSFSFYCLIKTLENGTSDVQTTTARTLMDSVKKNNRIIAMETADEQTSKARTWLHRFGYALAKSLARDQKLELKKVLLMSINNSSLVDGCIVILKSNNTSAHQAAEDVLIGCAATEKQAISRCVEFMSDSSVATKLESALSKMNRDQVLRVYIGKLTLLDMPTQKNISEIILGFARESEEQAASIARYSTKALSGSQDSNYLKRILLSINPQIVVQELIVSLDEERNSRRFRGCTAVLSQLALEKPKIVREVFEELAKGKIIRERKYDLTLKRLSRDMDTPYGKIAFAILESLEAERGSRYRRWTSAFKRRMAGKMPDFLKRKHAT